ncbi:polysaccharide biosynthesis C-terminal domain-containing protein [Paenibacillus sp. Soil750]|uniref:polysaccharide biosynthesis C-terminal domain-containing protein n=1 Tax=Paenibacillus sp. Soil750 TaxID=1736398 RepID=UPI0006FE1631|nr:NAD-dependent epimerase/dehydratase family protein [Paenibacillus sp. Soil750]KRE57656.1 capsular biosynthesis protein [Paenibacillus sp. Soil750]
MKILITGAKGFVGKNLIAELRNKGYNEIFEFTRECDRSLLEKYTENCDFVFHLAGVNRPYDEQEFITGNIDLTSLLLRLLKKYKNKAPVLLTSSIQAEMENPYGKSKKSAEDLLISYYKETGVKVYIYRLSNVYGKWSKPNYNTVVATFCHNVTRGVEIIVNNPETLLTLCYIDDVLEEFLRAIEDNPTIDNKYCVVPVTHSIKLGELAELLRSFKESRAILNIPNMENVLIKNLYSTYLSFLPEDKFSYELKMNCDNRGSFTEFIRTPERGQVSINVSKPGVTKGNHWHHSKTEKFLVVSGEALIRFRGIHSEEIIEYTVNGDKLQVIDIPSGYTHSIVNIGESDLVTVMWVNECFNSENPDTYFLKV